MVMGSYSELTRRLLAAEARYRLRIRILDFKNNPLEAFLFLEKGLKLISIIVEVLLLLN